MLCTQLCQRAGWQLPWNIITNHLFITLSGTSWNLRYWEKMLFKKDIRLSLYLSPNCFSPLFILQQSADLQLCMTTQPFRFQEEFQTILSNRTASVQPWYLNSWCEGVKLLTWSQCFLAVSVFPSCLIFCGTLWPFLCLCVLFCSDVVVATPSCSWAT